MTRFVSALAVVILALAGCRSDEPAMSGSEAAVTKGGKALYDQYCALCHGENLEGYAADDANALANADFLATASDRFLHAAIRQGRPGTAMAAYDKAYGGPLGHDEVDLLVTYIRSFQSEPSLKLSAAPVGGDAEAGRVVYERRCIGCHGREGGGNTALSLNNRVFLDTASDSYIRYAIAKGRRGTKMPSFEKRLKPEEIDNLTAYIRSLKGDDAALVEGEPPPSFENVVVNPNGPMPRFSPLREGRYVPMAEVAAALEAGARLVFLDARAPSDWMRSHIPGALPVPYYDPERMADALPRDGTWILAYCACPHAASGKVMDRLRSLGFENTAVIDEGILKWIEAGYPVATGKETAP